MVKKNAIKFLIYKNWTHSSFFVSFFPIFFLFKESFNCSCHLLSALPPLSLNSFYFCFFFSLTTPFLIFQYLVLLKYQFYIRIRHKSWWVILHIEVKFIDNFVRAQVLLKFYPTQHNDKFWDAQNMVVQLLSHVWLFAVPWIAACQASLSFSISWSLLKLMSFGSMMPCNHLILCRPPEVNIEKSLYFLHLEFFSEQVVYNMMR